MADLSSVAKIEFSRGGRNAIIRSGNVWAFGPMSRGKVLAKGSALGIPGAPRSGPRCGGMLWWACRLLLIRLSGTFSSQPEGRRDESGSDAVAFAPSAACGREWRPQSGRVRDL